MTSAAVRCRHQTRCHSRRLVIRASPDASADIGAHEVQKSDIVFYAEFETGCE